MMRAGGPAARRSRRPAAIRLAELQQKSIGDPVHAISGASARTTAGGGGGGGRGAGGGGGMVTYIINVHLVTDVHRAATVSGRGVQAATTLNRQSISGNGPRCEELTSAGSGTG